MKTNWLTGLIALALLVSCVGTVLLDCHGDCHEDCNCCATCPHACRCGVIQTCTFTPDIVYTTLSPNLAVRPSTGVCNGIFRPPTPLG